MSSQQPLTEKEGAVLVCLVYMLYYYSDCALTTTSTKLLITAKKQIDGSKAIGLTG